MMDSDPVLARSLQSALMLKQLATLINLGAEIIRIARELGIVLDREIDELRDAALNLLRVVGAEPDEREARGEEKRENTSPIAGRTGRAPGKRTASSPTDAGGRNQEA